MKIIQGAFAGKERMLKCGLHCHTTRSDGKGDPAEVMRIHAEKGYDYLAITDHRRYNYKNYAPETGLKIIPGMEMDRRVSSDEGMCFHTVCIGPEKEKGNGYEQDVLYDSGIVRDQYEYQPVLDETTNTFTIRTARELAWLAWKTADGNSLSGYTVELANDLDLSGKLWIPICNFEGMLDGKGHTIFNLRCAQGGLSVTTAASNARVTICNLFLWNTDCNLNQNYSSAPYSL